MKFMFVFLSFYLVGCFFVATSVKREEATMFVNQTQKEIRCGLQGVDSALSETDSLINVAAGRSQVQSIEIDWQQSQVEYLNRKFGAPQR